MGRQTRVITLSVALALVLGVPGCGSRDESIAPPATEPTPSPEAAPAEGALAPNMVRVRGTVRLAEGSELPAYTLEDIGRDPSRPDVPEGCSPARASDVNPMRISAQRGVGGILVTATGDLARFQAIPAEPPRTIAMAIRDCRLEPTLVVASVGDVIELTNRSPRAFITHFTTDPVNEAQAPERMRTLSITRPGVQRVECTMVAGCGRAEVVVLAHRVATVTDAEGHFELDVPAGAAVDLHAWHPLMRRREGGATLTIDRAVAGQTQTLDIELSLAPAPEPNLPVVPAPSAPGSTRNIGPMH